MHITKTPTQLPKHPHNYQNTHTLPNHSQTGEGILYTNNPYYTECFCVRTIRCRAEDIILE